VYLNQPPPSLPLKRGGVEGLEKEWINQKTKKVSPYQGEI